VTSPGIRSPVTPRRTLLGVRDRGDRGVAEPELSIASFGPRRGRQCVLEGSRPPRRIPRVEEFDDALDVPEGFPIKTTALTPAGCGVASTAPAPVPELVWRVCTTSLLAVASSPRWLSWGSCPVPLEIAASGSDTPSASKTVAFRLQGPRPVLTSTGQWEPHWRRQQSPFPSFHQVPERGAGFPVLALLGLPLLASRPSVLPFRALLPGFLARRATGCRRSVARLGFPSRVLAAVMLATGSSSQARHWRVAGVSPGWPPSRFPRRFPSVAAPGALETRTRLR
jgi:hypothetical protein